MLSSLPKRNRGNHLDRYANIKLSTNLYKVNFKESTKVYIYAFKSQPEIPTENVKKIRSILIASRSIVQRLIGPYAISGRTVFGSKTQKIDKGTQINFKLQYQGCAYLAIFKLVKEVCLGDILSDSIRSSGVVFSFLNNMVKNFFFELGYSQIGTTRKYFDSQHFKTLQSAKLKIFKGYSSSFTMLQSGLYLRIDPAVKIVRSQTVLQRINQLYRINNSLSREEKRIAVEAQLIGKMVMANYGKNKYYTIQSILFDSSIDVFTFDNGKKRVNLLQYYKTTYDIEIVNMKQPLVRVLGNKKERQNKCIIVLIPELLLMSGLPDDFDQRKRRDISQQTIIQPSEKLKDIEQIFNRMCQSKDSFNPKIISEKLGINIQTKPSKIQGKQLDRPQLQLGNKQRIEQHKATNFMLFDRPIFNTQILMKIVLIHPMGFKLTEVKDLMSSTCNNLKIDYKLITNEIKYQDTSNTLKNIQTIINKQSNYGANMFWFVIPASFKSSYSNIKKLVLKKGIQKNSQITVASTLQKKNFSAIFTKILLQMAAKVGNKLWVPKIPEKVVKYGVLMIGIQQYADSSDKNNIILSFCGNTNKQFSSFYSNFINHPRAETNKNSYWIKVVGSCLNQYYAKNKQIPKDVIILKNGSTKYDNRQAVKIEVDTIKETFKTFSKDQQIHLIYMLMDKDANQKFFAERGNQIANPSSGMLINSDAVGKGFQFYLVAQHCNKGTVKPTFYKVLYSDTFLDQGVIEELIFTQCFNYMNWSGSIKVPSVLQYAKKLSMFIGQYIGKEQVGTSLHNNLYYI